MRLLHEFLRDFSTTPKEISYDECRHRILKRPRDFCERLRNKSRLRVVEMILCCLFPYLGVCDCLEFTRSYSSSHKRFIIGKYVNWDICSGCATSQTSCWESGFLPGEHV